MIKFAAAASAALLVSAPIASGAPLEFAGFYAGAHAGYSDISAEFSGGDLSEGGSIGGLQAGYNFINGNFMYGVEIDLSLTGATPDGACPDSPMNNCEIESSPMATLRARAGYAMDDWLIYFTGGAAGSRFELDVNSGATPGDKTGLLGWTVGAGAEYLVGDIIGVKLEYRYLQFGDFDSGLEGPTGSDIDLDMHVIMGGINFHF